MDHWKFYVDIIPERIYIPIYGSLEVSRKKSNEGCCEYAIWWRKKIIRVYLFLVEEAKMTSYFIHALNLEYFDCTMMMDRKIFFETIKIGEIIEDGIKTRRMINLTELQSTHKYYNIGSFGNR